MGRAWAPSGFRGRATHYSGGLIVGNAHFAAGWPCCCSGRRAGLIRAQGNQTEDASKVDCKTCRRQIERARTTKEQP